MLQLPVRSPFGLTFSGKGIKDMKFLEKIKSLFQKNAVPEFGSFPPVTSIYDFEDKSRFTFTIQPLDGSNTGKKGTFAFVDSTSGKMAIKSKKFSSKQELETYINSLKDDDILEILKDFKQKTK